MVCIICSCFSVYGLFTNADLPVCFFASASGLTLTIALSIDLLWIHVYGSELWTGFTTKIAAKNTGADLLVSFILSAGDTNPSCPSLSLFLYSAIKFCEFREFSWNSGICFVFMSHVVSATVALLPPSASSKLNKRSLCEIWLSRLRSVSVPNTLKLQFPAGEPWAATALASVSSQLHHFFPPPLALLTLKWRGSSQGHSLYT